MDLLKPFKWFLILRG